MKYHAAVAGQSIELELGSDGAVFLNDKSHRVECRILETGLLSLLVDDHSYEIVVRRELKGGKPTKNGFVVELAGHLIPVRFEEPGQKGAAGVKEEEGSGTIESPMPGRIVTIKVSLGQEVKLGEGIMVVEAMKMENELTSSKSGKVKEIKVKVGEAVEAGQELMVIE